MLPARADATSQYFARHVLNAMASPEMNTPEVARELGRTGMQAREQYVARAFGSSPGGSLAGAGLP
jgi:hypothetical protein